MSRWSGRKRYPLRKIVGERMEKIAGSDVEQRVEVLECGHTQPIRQDIIGETNASRRRCRRCGVVEVVVKD